MIYFSKVYICFYYRIKHLDMNIWIKIFFEIKIFKSYPIWSNIITIYVMKNWCGYRKWFSISSFQIHCIYTFVPLSNH
jgi:hypothetical protein